MEKIEPVAWVKTCQDDLIGKVIKSVTQDPNNSSWHPLYTREALEAAVEGTIWVMVQRAVTQGKDAGFTCGISLDEVMKQIQIMQENEHG